MLETVILLILAYLIYFYLYSAKIIWEYLDQIIKDGLKEGEIEEAKELSANRSLKMSDLKKAWVIIRHYEQSKRKSILKGKFNVK